MTGVVFSKFKARGVPCIPGENETGNRGIWKIAKKVTDSDTFGIKEENTNEYCKKNFIGILSDHREWSSRAGRSFYGSPGTWSIDFTIGMA